MGSRRCRAVVRRRGDRRADPRSDQSGAGGLDRAERAKALSAAASRRSRKSPPIAAVTAPEPARERVLLVDDDAGLRLLLRTTLPASEFDVEEADSAETAAETARFFRPGSRDPRRQPPGQGRAHILSRAQAFRALAPRDLAHRRRHRGRTAAHGRGRRGPAEAVQPGRAAHARGQGQPRARPGGRRRIGFAGRAALDLRARPEPRRRGRARAATAPPARVSPDRDRSGRRTRGERPVDGSSRPPCSTLRARARRGVRRVPGRRSQSRVRVPAPRRRQDRNPGDDSPQAGSARRAASGG